MGDQAAGLHTHGQLARILLRVVAVEVGATDDDLVTAMSEATKTGIDCPLGWPVKFIDFIGRHQHDHVEVVQELAAREWRRQFSYRVTDLHVREMGIQGLSVSTDRVGVTTMRCGAIMPMCHHEVGVHP